MLLFVHGTSLGHSFAQASPKSTKDKDGIVTPMYDSPRMVELSKPQGSESHEPASEFTLRGFFCPNMTRVLELGML